MVPLLFALFRVLALFVVVVVVFYSLLSSSRRRTRHCLIVYCRRLIIMIIICRIRHRCRRHHRRRSRHRRSFVCGAYVFVDQAPFQETSILEACCLLRCRLCLRVCRGSIPCEKKATQFCHSGLRWSEAERWLLTEGHNVRDMMRCAIYAGDSQVLPASSK